jgi:hypothetical protein
MKRKKLDKGIILATAFTIASFLSGAILPPSSSASSSKVSHSSSSSPCKTYGAGYIATENKLKGDATLYSRITHSSNPTVNLYLSSTYGECGNTIKVYGAGKGNVSLSIYRLGYYSGLGSKLVLKDTALPKALASGSSIATQHDSADGIKSFTYTAKYNQVYSFTIPPTWTPGEYAVKLSTPKESNLAYLSIANPNGTEPVVYVSSSNTFQAYNYWGGGNAYKDESFVLDYNRPININAIMGFKNIEWPTLYTLEKNGIDTAIITDETFRDKANPLANHKVIVFGTHSEYWSQKEMDQVKSASLKGQSVINFGANEGNWAIRFEGSRQFASYKILIRDTSFPPTASYHQLNETTLSLFGTTYGCRRGLGIPAIDSSSWILTNTSWASASTNTVNLPDLFLGGAAEIDTAQSGAPEDTQYLTSVPIICAGGTLNTQWSIAYRPASSQHGMTFSTGTEGWGLTLEGIFSSNIEDKNNGNNIAIMTMTVINKALN